jgi:nucleoid DNA-binding protein
LTPKKASDFIDEVAKDLNLNPKLVDVIITAYWNDVRKKLSGLEYQRINVPNLGIFAVRYNKLKELQMRYDGYIKQKESVNTFKRYSYIYDAKNYSEKIDKLFEKLIEDKQKKSKIKEIRRNGSKNNLEKQDANS